MKPFVPNASLGLNDATRIPSAAIFIVFASWPLTMTVAPTPGGASAMARPVVRLLSENGYDGKLVLFNGSNADQQFKMIYENWSERNKGTDRITGSRRADMRAALVEYFRDKAAIMIATEAAAEGINLQFCSMVVNYDLPWNP